MKAKERKFLRKLEADKIAVRAWWIAISFSIITALYFSLQPTPTDYITGL